MSDATAGRPSLKGATRPQPHLPRSGRHPAGCLARGLLPKHREGDAAAWGDLHQSGEDVITPVIFLTVVLGIAQTADLKRVGRVGLKALLYFEVVTTLALAIGLLVHERGAAGEGD